MYSQKKDQIIQQAAVAYGGFLSALGFDWQNDEHMKNTPTRVAKAWVNDLAAGCFMEKPEIRTFPNTNQYDGVVFSGRLDVVSMCSHHNLPFVGYAYAAYIPHTYGKVIGLSKFNRIVDYHSRRPQVQENLTMDIFNAINTLCEGNQGVALLIEARHMCCQLRGVKQGSIMKTSKMSGAFLDEGAARQEFYDFVRDLPPGIK